MTILKNKICYLSSSIQYSTDHSWRDRPKEIIRERFGLKVIDPFSDEKQLDYPNLQNALLSQDYLKIQSITERFVRRDLARVDRADLLIAYIQLEKTTGQVHEIVNAVNYHKPVLLVSATGNLSDIPLWYFGFIDWKYFFKNWDDLFKYLQEVEDKQHTDDDKWWYIYEDVKI